MQPAGRDAMAEINFREVQQTTKKVVNRSWNWQTAHVRGIIRLIGVSIPVTPSAAATAGLTFPEDCRPVISMAGIRASFRYQILLIIPSLQDAYFWQLPSR